MEQLFAVLIGPHEPWALAWFAKHSIVVKIDGSERREFLPILFVGRWNKLLTTELERERVKSLYMYLKAEETTIAYNFSALGSATTHRKGEKDESGVRDGWPQRSKSDIGLTPYQASKWQGSTRKTHRQPCQERHRQGWLSVPNRI